MSYFGDLIRRERGSLSLSQAARLIGCTKAHLWELEAARSRNPSIRLLDGMAAAYGLSVGFLAEAAATSLDAPTPGCANPAEPAPGNRGSLSEDEDGRG